MRRRLQGLDEDFMEDRTPEERDGAPEAQRPPTVDDLSPRAGEQPGVYGRGSGGDGAGPPQPGAMRRPVYATQA